ncbi:UNVERIFIED_CONTAM: hypothetical protein HDU68_011071 [Siphonaria sp. JEL0065]|nr:hypothetical protein HDU68_011071 [Siphonaria sp. JEL0065]
MTGSKDIYIYLEPGHILLHELHRPFLSHMSDEFNFTAPATIGPYIVAFYDVEAAGVREYPFLNVQTVAVEVVSVLPSTTTTSTTTATTTTVDGTTATTPYPTPPVV